MSSRRLHFLIPLICIALALHPAPAAAQDASTVNSLLQQINNALSQLVSLAMAAQTTNSNSGSGSGSSGGSGSTPSGGSGGGSTPTPPPPPAPASNISAVWANEGGDKVTQDELRATNHKENLTGTVLNKAWDGTTISLFSARNEVVSFNLVLEAATAAAPSVNVTFDTLTGPNGSTIHSTPAADLTGVFQWTNRPIELFLAHYVPIQGLSYFGYFKGDERQIPVRFQAASHQWTDRPDHDKNYPDELIPIEVKPAFAIAQGQNQSVWADIYVPKTATPGNYTGTVTVSEAGTVTKTIPVKLTVEPFALPDTPSMKTMIHLDTADILHRYAIVGYDNFASTAGKKAKAMTDLYYEMFHRHKLSLEGENECVANNTPCDTSAPRLNGSLYTAANGYDGPGVATPETIFSIGTYGTWAWSWHSDQNAMTAGLTSFGSWFRQNVPNADVILYLADEPPSSQYPQIETWAKWMSGMTGDASRVLSAVTMPWTTAATQVPDLRVPIQPSGVGNCPAGQTPCDNTKITQALHDVYSAAPNQAWTYNDGRPGAGSAMTEDDGIAMRTFGWAQWKKNIHRWFYWFANNSCGPAKMNCGDWYSTATTWGGRNYANAQWGQWNDNDTPSNGNGVIVYPGTDLENPGSSLNLPGPVASLRMKAWRRGIQDADYLTIANTIDPAATAAVVAATMPQAQWEVADSDPTYYQGPISWSSNPDSWESGRAQLAAIIAKSCAANASQSFCH